MHEVLGEGAFAKVCKAWPVEAAINGRYSDRNVMACKIVEKGQLKSNKGNEVNNEIRLLSRLKSDNVIKMHCAYQTPNRYYLMCDVCNGGDLQMLMKTRRRLSEEEGKKILRQLVKGMSDLYSQQIVHRDIKLANVMIHFPEEP